MPAVTLLTDFGTVDGYAGAMKGVIHALAPTAALIDITHEVAPQDVAGAAHALAVAAPAFPPGTVHVVVVDPGVGTTRIPVVVDDGRQLYVGPDNGVFDLAVPRPTRVFAIEAPGFRAGQPSATFHGRDVFAVAAGRLAAGAVPPDAGPAVSLRCHLAPPGSAPAGGALVIHVDRFGNLVTDTTADRIPSGGRIAVAGHDVGPLRRTYADVAPGELVAYIGSSGTLEIAVRDGSAAQRLSVGRGAAVIVQRAPDE